MEMCVRITKKLIFPFLAAAFLAGCGDMDTLLPTSGTYKINAQVNGVILDDLSFVSVKDEVQVFFEDSVSEDPDVTALMVFFKDLNGNTGVRGEAAVIVGWKVIYTLETADSVQKQDSGVSQSSKRKTRKETSNKDPNIITTADEENEAEDSSTEDSAKEDTSANKTAPNKNGEELIVSVKSLDELPSFPIPSDLPIGRYMLVSSVMHGDEILQKDEKPFFYLADAVFSFDNVYVYQPGVSFSPQLISNSSVIMLEAGLEYDSTFDPYIVWYNGKKIISEGSISEGAGKLLWKAPEQSGFFSLRVEAFPVMNRQGFTGYQKDISLLVSSKNNEIYLASEDDSGLIHWYLFEGSLFDTKNNTSAEFALKPEGGIDPQWTAANGTYGLASGPVDVYRLPVISLTDYETNSGRFLFRFKPLKDGDIFSVEFEAFADVSADVKMHLSMESGNLVLTLVSPSEIAAYQTAVLEPEDFITVVIDFSLFSDRLSAQMVVIEKLGEQDLPLAASFINMEQAQAVTAVVKDVSGDVFNGNLKTIMGIQNIKITVNETEATNEQAAVKKPAAPVLTALWNEFAFLSRPPRTEDEIVKKEAKPEVKEAVPAAAYETNF